MGSLVVFASLLVYYFLASDSTVEGTRWNLSKAEDLDFERQLKLLNKPAIKTINTRYGDIYDCIDFYKQPAFDHPLLKNYTSNSQEINIESSFGLKNEKCPIGTVPIRRITKQNLMREKLASPNGGGGGGAQIDYSTNYALCNMDGAFLKGVQAIMSVHNPSVSGTQYSAARIKLVVNGHDSIEAGWRVDPTLYGDTQTRLYIRTQTAQTNCFNTRCPGFVITREDIPLDLVLDEISQRGGPIYEVSINIIYVDIQERWILQVGPDNAQVGYWPKAIFGSTELPNHAEWGGETYKPAGMLSPPMGTGYYLRGHTDYDAFMRVMKIVSDQGFITDPRTTGDVTSIYYDIKVDSHADDYFQYLMVYGGPGHLT